MNTLTQALLLECKKVRYTHIAICTISKEVPNSLTFPPDYATFSIFAYPDRDFSKECQHPAIWEIVEMFPILESSCGNSHQSQIRRYDLLTKGVYNLNELFLEEFKSSKKKFIIEWSKHRPEQPKYYSF